MSKSGWGIGLTVAIGYGIYAYNKVGLQETAKTTLADVRSAVSQVTPDVDIYQNDLRHDTWFGLASADSDQDQFTASVLARLGHTEFNNTELGPYQQGDLIPALHALYANLIMFKQSWDADLKIAITRDPDFDKFQINSDTVEVKNIMQSSAGIKNLSNQVTADISRFKIARRTAHDYVFAHPNHVTLDTTGHWHVDADFPQYSDPAMTEAANAGFNAATDSLNTNLKQTMDDSRQVLGPYVKDLRLKEDNGHLFIEATRDEFIDGMKQHVIEKCTSDTMPQFADMIALGGDFGELYDLVNLFCQAINQPAASVQDQEKRDSALSGLQNRLTAQDDTIRHLGGRLLGIAINVFWDDIFGMSLLDMIAAAGEILAEVWPILLADNNNMPAVPSHRGLVAKSMPQRSSSLCTMRRPATRTLSLG